MADSWKDLLGRARAAFRDARTPRDPEDQVAELLGAMRRELHAARVHLKEVDVQLDRTRRELQQERGELATCERRRTMAERIGDAQTVQVASEWAARHAERAAVLEAKLRAGEAERAQYAADADRMARAYRDADTNRWTLVARARERGAAGAAQGSLAELDRLAGRVHSEAAEADAFAEVDAALGTGPSAAELAHERSARESDADARLAELKRRMGSP